jgi:Icc-related predicted phosphoesterase
MKETHTTAAPRLSVPTLPSSSSSRDNPVLLCSKDGLLDVLVTHDWPSGAANTFLEQRQDERCRILGNEPCQWLLDELPPTLMLCGHMHTAHRAVMDPSTVRCLAKVPASGSIAFF